MSLRSERIEQLVRTGKPVPELLTAAERETLEYYEVMYKHHPCVQALAKQYLWMRQMLRLHPGHRVADLFNESELEN